MKKAWYRLFRNEWAFTWAILLLTIVPLVPDYVAFACVIAALIAAMIDAHRRNTVIQIGALGKLILVYLAYIAIGILYSAHPLNSLATFAMWGAMFCGYLTVTTVICNRHRLHTAIFLVGVAAALVGGIACAQYLLINMLGKHIPNQFWFELDRWVFSHLPLGFDLYTEHERVCATFNNPNILGQYLVLAMPFIAYHGFSETRTRQALLSRVFLFIAILGAAVTLSRGAYIAMLSILLMFFVFNFKKTTPLVLCIVAALSLIPEAITSRFLSIGQGKNDFAIFERFEAWDVAIQTIISRPLFGLGPGINNFWEQLKNAGVGAHHSHNLILQLLVEGGFVSLFIMCMLAIRTVHNSLELTNEHRRGSGLGKAMVMYVVAFGVYGMVDYPFLSPKLVGIFLITVGFADTVSHIYLHQRFLPFRSVPITVWQSIRNRATALKRKKI